MFDTQGNLPAQHILNSQWIAGDLPALSLEQKSLVFTETVPFVASKSFNQTQEFVSWK